MFSKKTIYWYKAITILTFYFYLKWIHFNLTSYIKTKTSEFLIKIIQLSYIHKYPILYYSSSTLHFDCSSLNVKNTADTWREFNRFFFILAYHYIITFFFFNQPFYIIHWIFFILFRFHCSSDIVLNWNRI